MRFTQRPSRMRTPQTETLIQILRLNLRLLSRFNDWPALSGRGVALPSMLAARNRLIVATSVGYEISNPPVMLWCSASADGQGIERGKRMFRSIVNPYRDHRN